MRSGAASRPLTHLTWSHATGLSPRCGRLCGSAIHAARRLPGHRPHPDRRALPGRAAAGGPARLLPPAGRRTALLAHAYRLQLIGLATRVFTSWLDVSGDGAASPRTPPRASSHCPARNRCWSPTDCSPSTGSGRHDRTTADHLEQLSWPGLRSPATAPQWRRHGAGSISG